MISQLNSSMARMAYTNNADNTKTIKPNASVSTKEDGATKVEQLKAAIEAGEYKLDLSKLAQKMADELM